MSLVSLPVMSSLQKSFVFHIVIDQYHVTVASRNQTFVVWLRNDDLDTRATILHLLRFVKCWFVNTKVLCNDKLHYNTLVFLWYCEPGLCLCLRMFFVLCLCLSCWRSSEQNNQTTEVVAANVSTTIARVSLSSSGEIEYSSSEASQSKQVIVCHDVRGWSQDVLETICPSNFLECETTCNQEARGWRPSSSLVTSMTANDLFPNCSLVCSELLLIQMQTKNLPLCRCLSLCLTVLRKCNATATIKNCPNCMQECRRFFIQ